MIIQYVYALLTMTPCPLWFRSRWASGVFLAVLFAYCVYNGATYYIDIFGLRFQKELEQLKKDVAKWQKTPEMKGMVGSPPFLPNDVGGGEKILGHPAIDVLDSPSVDKAKAEAEQLPNLSGSVGPEGKPVGRSDRVPLLDGSAKSASGADMGRENGDGVRERKVVRDQQ